MNKPFYCGPHDRAFAIGGHCPDCVVERGNARAAADDALSNAGLGVPIDVGPVVKRMEQHNAEAREALANFRAAASEADPHGLDQHAPGAKLDAGKPRPWLVVGSFSRALMAVTDVGTKGAIKYTPNGWAQVQDGEARYMEAFGRHMLALGRGETVDPETQCLHKAQMIWNLLASLELELRAADQWARK